MKSFIFLFSLFLCLSSPAYAEDAPVTKADTATMRDIPLRADQGLTKAEGQIAEGKYTQALDTLGGVLARRPGDADALTYMGAVWQHLGDIKQAAENFDKAIKYDPQHLGANTYRAELYLEEGNFPRALEQLQAIRLICAGTPCGELDRLQSALNAARMGKKPAPAEPPTAETNTPPN
jgi:Tfp pilus assembly protein PilF